MCLRYVVPSLFSFLYFINRHVLPSHLFFFFFQLHDGLIPWLGLRDGSFLSSINFKGDHRARQDREKDGAALWKKLNQFLDFVVEESMLYDVLRSAEPPSLSVFSPSLKPHRGTYSRREPPMRRGERGVEARFEHVLHVLTHLREHLSPQRWDELSRLRREFEHTCNNVIAQANSVLSRAKQKGRIMLIGAEGLLSTMGLCAVLGLQVDYRDVWTVKGSVDMMMGAIGEARKYDKVRTRGGWWLVGWWP